MNVHARDAVIAVCVTGVIIAALLITGDLVVLWLLFLLLLVVFT